MEPFMYAVVNMYPGYAREDPGTPHLVAVVEDKEVAEKLRLVAGGDAKVFPVTLNAIPPGLVTHAQSYGIDTSKWPKP